MLLYEIAPQLTVASAILPGNLCGCYDEVTQTILIDRRLTYEAKKCALVHELVHWKRGDRDCGDIGETRTRRETAARLVSPLEYAAAERIYGNDVYALASELGVTVPVIEDFRTLLHEAADQSIGG